MKILHIDPDDIERPESGGGPVRTFEIYRRLSDRHEITVLTPNFEGAESPKIKDGIKYVRIGNKFRDHRSTYFISFFALAPFVAREYECDLIVEDLMPPADVTLTPLLNRKYPVIASAQWFFAEKISKILKFPFHRLRRRGIKNYKYFIALAEDVREKILSMHEKAVVQLIPNGVDDDLFVPEPVYGDFILYLGRIDEGHKGTDLLIESFRRIADKTDIDLVVAGSGMSESGMKALVAKYGLGERVKFVGKVGFTEKKKLLSECRFAAIPSRFETFGMVAMETFASAKTAVVFDIPNLRDITRKEHALSVVPFNCDEYARALLKLSEDKDAAVSMGKKAREFAHNYKWDDVAREQEDFYNKCVRMHKTNELQEKK